MQAANLSSPLKRYDPAEESESHPTTLFHYTSATAFLAILKDKRIRLGRLSAMNDTKEHSWLREIAHEIATRRLDAYLAKPLRFDPSRIDEYYRTILGLLEGPVLCDPYCACFSVRGDLLSQWRAYANDAQGFAIGFSVESLTYGKGREPRRVAYLEDEHRKHVENFFDTLEHHNRAVNDPVSHARDRSHQAYQFVISHAVQSKNPHFAEEAEYRVVHDAFDRTSIPGQTLNAVWPPFDKDYLTPSFVERGGHILHYLELALHAGGKSIRKIVVGPRNPARSSPETLRLFLKANGYDHLVDEIYESSGTLR